MKTIQMDKPFIHNVSLQNFKEGIHRYAGGNSMAIQICDPDTEFPKSPYEFKIVKQYKFLDVENGGGLVYTGAITKEQAKSIADDLIYALQNNMNVIVHCHMGICRSGAVVEVGEMMGFEGSSAFRAPNLLVKSMMVNYLMDEVFKL